MISLYESILSDIEDTLDYGDSKAPEMAANIQNSDLRNFFDFNILNAPCFAVRECSFKRNR